MLYLYAMTDYLGVSLCDVIYVSCLFTFLYPTDQIILLLFVLFLMLRMLQGEKFVDKFK